MDYAKERQEAIQAGNMALSSLKEARALLGDARGFGIWDLLGGGTFVSLFKHYKIDRARQAIERARLDLNMFNNELRDISMSLNIDIGDVLMFFDVYDSFIADAIVQSRIADACSRLDNAILQVNRILSSL